MAIYGGGVYEGIWVSVKARLTLRGDQMAEAARKARAKSLNSPKETYSPVFSHITLRLLSATYAAAVDVLTSAADLHSAYLHARMRKKVAIKLPARWRVGGADTVHTVIMALYGGDDSGRCFYDHWVDFHVAMGFKTITHDMA